MLVSVTSPGVFAEHRRQLLCQKAGSSKSKSAYQVRSKGIALKDRLKWVGGEHIEQVKPNFEYLPFDAGSIERFLLEMPEGRWLASRFLPVSWRLGSGRGKLLWDAA
ncbi:hypothetical protein [Rhizobium leguminosarum]|nr:hypothetical protein [Rhizobium leguminosarum]